MGLGRKLAWEQMPTEMNESWTPYRNRVASLTLIFNFYLKGEDLPFAGSLLRCLQEPVLASPKPGALTALNSIWVSQTNSRDPNT